jgi:ABC-type Fe3+ transport system substrate-binding protein
MTQLQTLFDFPRWKKMGVLLDYKPAGSGKVYDKFKDPDGAWAAIGVYSFSTVFNTRLAGGDSAITSPKDLAAATWKGKIQSSYPNDDDAVLYLFRQYVNAYGWDWMSKVAANGVTFARGSNTANDKVTAGSKTVGAGTFGSPVTVAGATVKWLFPADSGFPFMAWGQRAAIFKAAKHPAAAKLYLNWQLSTERQTPNAGWSVRTDVSPPTGLKPIWDYPSANVNGFADFMEDRAAAERWRQTFTLYIGEVQGAPTPGILGLHPGASA